MEDVNQSSTWSVKEDDDQNKEGETKRNDSMKKEKEKKRKWLIQLIDDSKVLWRASGGGHVGVVEKILEVVGINVNVAGGSDDSTPLYKASNNGHAEIIQILLDAGATPLPPPFARGNEDQIGLYTDQKCSEGHGLVRFNVPEDESHGCDLCRENLGKSLPLAKNTVAYGCDKCDYDICTSCAQ